MVKKKHIGFVVFSICSALSARIALFEPKSPEPTAAEQRWGSMQRDEDPWRLIHGLRYYVYGVGLLGLLVVAEDYLTEALTRSKTPTPK